MDWIYNINDLSYYNTPQGATCYCENLVYPSDLTLQGSFTTGSLSSLTLTVNVYSADGLTNYEDATSYFEYYFFTFNGVKYFNLRLKSFSPAMCLHKCWILRVTVTRIATVLFDAFTDRYCQAGCCDVPRGITIDVDDQPGRLVIGDPAAAEPVLPTGTCGQPLIRITSTFPCFDNFNNEFYGIPSGQTWGLVKVTNIEGEILNTAREITRTISYNCVLQRSESFKPYHVRSNELFPAWKLNEFEVMFHAPSITISDFITERSYQYAGGVVASQPYDCWQMWKLDTVVQDCTKRQTFGCSEDCTDGQALFFAIPEWYQGGNYYSEQRIAVASSVEGLESYFLAQPGVNEVEDVTGDYNGFYAVLRVGGLGYIPTSIYFDNPTQRNRIYGVSSLSDFVVSCRVIDVLDIVVTEQVCLPIDVLDIVVTEQEGEVIVIHDYEDWVITNQVVSKAGTTVYMDVESSNTTLPPSEDPVQFLNIIIGRIDPAGWPANPISISHEDNENVPENSLLTIDTTGVIRWTGPGTTVEEEITKIAVNNIYYGTAS